MGELTITTFLTSGGFPYGGCVHPLADADMGKIMVDIFSKADAFLLGLTTYEIFAGSWPKVTDPNDPIAGKLNALPKFVASRTRTSFDWNRTGLVRDAATEAVEIKKRFPGELQVHGSGTVPAPLTLVRAPGEVGCGRR